MEAKAKSEAKSELENSLLRMRDINVVCLICRIVPIL